MTIKETGAWEYTSEYVKTIYRDVIYLIPFSTVLYPYIICWIYLYMYMPFT